MLIMNESLLIFLKRRQFVIYRTACYLIKQRSTTLVIKRSKNYNAMASCQKIQIRLLLFLLFDVNFFFVLLCFGETNFDVFTIFSELSGIKRIYMIIHENIYTNEKLNPFSNKICNFYVKRKKKKVIF